MASTLLMGCFGSEQPLPPEQALARAAERINYILAEDRSIERTPVLPPLDEAPKDPSAVTFWYYSHPLIAPALSPPDRLAAFQAAHPDVKLERQFIGEWTFAVQKLMVSLAADDLPDVATVKWGWLAALAHSGRIAALDEILPDTFMSDVRQAHREALSVDGKLYGLPADGYCAVLFYNRDIVGASPPKTWEELRAVAVSARAKAPSDRFYPIGDFPFLEALWSTGGDVVEANQCGLDRADAWTALKFVLALRDDGMAHPRAIGNPALGFDLFLRGEVAMTVTSSEFLLLTEKAQFPVGVAPIPGKNGGISSISDNAIVVFRRHAQSKRAAIATALDFLTGPEVQGENAAKLGSVPVRSSVAQTVTPPDGMEAAYAVARSRPLLPAWNEIESEMFRYLDLAYRWRPAGK